jgi:hypothetical protein
VHVVRHGAVLKISLQKHESDFSVHPFLEQNPEMGVERAAVKRSGVFFFFSKEKSANTW